MTFSQTCGTKILDLQAAWLSLIMLRSDVNKFYPIHSMYSNLPHNIDKIISNTQVLNTWSISTYMINISCHLSPNIIYEHHFKHRRLTLFYVPQLQNSVIILWSCSHVHHVHMYMYNMILFVHYNITCRSMIIINDNILILHGNIIRWHYDDMTWWFAFPHKIQHCSKHCSITLKTF